MSIEKSIFTNEPEKFDLNKYDRLYFGNEFCENNILSVQKVKKILSLDIPKTFVTPYLSDKGIKKIISILKIIPENTEVVFNDYGLLRYLKPFTPVFGRLLNKQKRGPRIIELRKHIPQKGYDYFKQSNIPAMESFLKKRGIYRAEIDNVIQCFDIKTNMKISLYYPYVYVSTTRLCMLNGIEDLSRKELKIGPCKKECVKYLLHNDKFPIDMVLKGNTQFYKNEKIPKKGFDRLVFFPDHYI